MRRAKIVATLGPALSDPDRLRAAIEAGIDVVRLNFSHGTAEEHAERLRQVHDIAADLGRNVGSIGDLQGPKIRLGLLPQDGIELDDDGDVELVGGSDELEGGHDGGMPLLPVVYEHLADDLEPGSLVLIDDGLVRLEVTSVTDGRVRARVLVGGVVTSRKGVNLPGVRVTAASLTPKDREDVQAMVDIGVDWIALSFVRRAADVIELRELVRSIGGVQPIVSKLERPEALDNLDEILEVTDAVMVARGDLGVEIGPEQVPSIQKEIIDLANQASRPVITATEMLESMIRSPRPTRAEASDVANAVFDGSDAMMLSGETAAGRYPVQAVQTMARIIEVAEGSGHRIHAAEPATVGATGRVVAKAAQQIADDVDAKVILVFSLSGASVQLVSKFRPSQPVIGLTTDERSLRRLALMWGTDGHMTLERDHSRDLIFAGEQICLDNGYAVHGDRVVIVSGIPGGRGGTNRVLVHRIGDLSDEPWS